MAKKQTTESQITFTEEDVKLLQQFGQLLVSKATFNLSLQDSINLTRYVSHLNGITKKIEAHILEVKKIVSLEENDASNTNKR